MAVRVCTWGIDCLMWDVPDPDHAWLSLLVGRLLWEWRYDVRRLGLEGVIVCMPCHGNSGRMV